MTDEAIRFGAFVLYPQRRALVCNDAPMRLGSRALEILIVLLDEPGKVVSKDEMFRRVWPSSVVEETNLRVHMAALRKVLGDGKGGERFIQSVPLRGYCFVAPVQKEANPAHKTRLLAPATSNAVSVQDELPLQLTPVIGRDEVIEILKTALPQRKHITLVGAAGIGKTTLAVAIARSLSDQYSDGVRFVDLASVASEQIIASTVGAVLGISVSGTEPLNSIATFLRNRNMLLVVDNCEHVLGAATALVEAIRRRAPSVHIVATSREPLRAAGEWLQRLPSLTTPGRSIPLTAAAALAFSAIRLFVERAVAGDDTFVFEDSDVALVAQICRRLDGIPLAIELAAASLGVYGLTELSRRLEQKFSILTRGRRTALARHQTLSAALDWSYQALSPDEQWTLRRLSAFQGTFDSISALELLASSDMGPDSTLGCISNLAAKSLLSADVSGESVQYRLLEMTRAYAYERSTELGEVDAARMDHALLCSRLFERADSEWSGQPTALWLTTYRGRIDDLRAALKWAFSADGDVQLGIALTSWSLPLWFALSNLEEYRDHAAHALEALALLSSPSLMHEMRINEGFGHALWHTRVEAIGMIRAFDRARILAQQLQSKSLEMRAAWGLWTSRMTTGEYDLAIKISNEIGAAAAVDDDLAGTLIHHRTMALASHLNGQHDVAFAHASEVRLNSLNAKTTARSSGIQFDQRSMSSAVLSRLLWVQGYPDQALKMAAVAIEEGLATDHAVSICFVVTSGAGIVPIWTGSFGIADEYAALACARADELSLTHWQNYAHSFREILSLRAYERENPEHQARIAPHNKNFGHMLGDLLATLHESFVNDTLIRRVESGFAGFAAPEVLRVQGVRAALTLGSTTEIAADFLRRSLVTARSQGAKSWELRTAISMAQIWHATDRANEGMETLQKAFSSFEEGFDTQDLRLASVLLAR